MLEKVEGTAAFVFSPQFEDEIVWHCYNMPDFLDR